MKKIEFTYSECSELEFLINERVEELQDRVCKWEDFRRNCTTRSDEETADIVLKANRAELDELKVIAEKIKKARFIA